MSNIGWEKYQNNKSTALPIPESISEENNVEKHPFVNIIKVTKDMDENQVKFFSERNSMVEFLKKHGLMESK